VCFSPVYLPKIVVLITLIPLPLTLYLDNRIPNLELSLFIARRHWLRQKGAFSAFIIRMAIAATAVSVAVMILAVAFITGFKQAIRAKLFSYWGHVLVVPYNPNPANLISAVPIRQDSQLMQQIRSLPQVRRAAPFALRPAIIQAKGQMEGIKLKGVAGDFTFNEGLAFSGSPIHYPDTGYAQEVILSQTTADRLNIQAGDSILIYFVQAGSTFPSIRKVRVAGAYHTGMDDIDRYFGICDLRLLQRINRWTADDINGYQIDLKNEADMAQVADTLFYRYTAPPLAVETIRDTYPAVFDWLALQNVNGRIILAIMGIVAIINLSVALIILMVDQAKMVGVLKTLGMRPAAVRKIFLYKALLIAGVGILLGNVLSLGICRLQSAYGFLRLSEETYYMKQVPVALYGWQILLIDGGTLLLCFVCMWLPVSYLRRIQPIKVLQFK
jgi:lipoprotein-releasing system permease protein